MAAGMVGQRFRLGVALGQAAGRWGPTRLMPSPCWVAGHLVTQGTLCRLSGPVTIRNEHQALRRANGAGRKGRLHRQFFLRRVAAARAPTSPSYFLVDFVPLQRGPSAA